MTEAKKNCSEGNKMTLADYYSSLPEKTRPKSDFVERVAERCGLSPTTIRFWVWGKTKPSKPEFRQILSEETGIPVENLF